ncbi:MAG: hypothetical protein LBB54_05945 [Cellulomonadaceae bacterium]|nr:hypothetical protein [Cellulomonadaceae bacterium]
MTSATLVWRRIDQETGATVGPPFRPDVHKLRPGQTVEVTFPVTVTASGTTMNPRIMMLSANLPPTIDNYADITYTSTPIEVSAHPQQVDVTMTVHLRDDAPVDYRFDMDFNDTAVILQSGRLWIASDTVSLGVVTAVHRDYVDDEEQAPPPIRNVCQVDIDQLDWHDMFLAPGDNPNAPWGRCLSVGIVEQSWTSPDNGWVTPYRLSVPVRATRPSELPINTIAVVREDGVPLTMPRGILNNLYTADRPEPVGDGVYSFDLRIDFTVPFLACGGEFLIAIEDQSLNWAQQSRAYVWGYLQGNDPGARHCGIATVPEVTP